MNNTTANYTEVITTFPALKTGYDVATTCSIDTILNIIESEKSPLRTKYNQLQNVESSREYTKIKDSLTSIIPAIINPENGEIVGWHNFVFYDIDVKNLRLLGMQYAKHIGDITDEFKEALSTIPGIMVVKYSPSFEGLHLIAKVDYDWTVHTTRVEEENFKIREYVSELYKIAYRTLHKDILAKVLPILKKYDIGTSKSITDRILDPASASIQQKLTVMYDPDAYINKDAIYQVDFSGFNIAQFIDSQNVSRLRNNARIENLNINTQGLLDTLHKEKLNPFLTKHYDLTGHSQNRNWILYNWCYLIAQILKDEKQAYEMIMKLADIDKDNFTKSKGKNDHDSDQYQIEKVHQEAVNLIRRQHAGNAFVENSFISKLKELIGAENLTIGDAEIVSNSKTPFSITLKKTLSHEDIIDINKKRIKFSMKEADEVITIDQRYIGGTLNKMDLEEHKQVLFTSDTGMGKTTGLVQFAIDECKQKKSTLYIVPRRTLLKQMEVELKDNEQVYVVKSGEKYIQPDQAHLCIVVLDSAINKLAHKMLTYDNIIIDEIDTILNDYTFKGDTIIHFYSWLEALTSANKKLIYCTATPNPIYAFNDLYHYHFKSSLEAAKTPKFVNITSYNNSEIKPEIVAHNLLKIDAIGEDKIDYKVCIFNDLRKLSVIDELVNSMNGADNIMITSETDIEDDNYLEVAQGYIKPIVNATKVVTSGNNFLNEGVYHFILFDVTDIDELLQYVGRARRSNKVYITVVVNSNISADVNTDTYENGTPKFSFKTITEFQEMYRAILEKWSGANIQERTSFDADEILNRVDQPNILLLNHQIRTNNRIYFNWNLDMYLETLKKYYGYNTFQHVNANDLVSVSEADTLGLLLETRALMNKTIKERNEFFWNNLSEVLNTDNEEVKKKYKKQINAYYGFVDFMGLNTEPEKVKAIFNMGQKIHLAYWFTNITRVLSDNETDTMKMFHKADLNLVGSLFSHARVLIAKDPSIKKAEIKQKLTKLLVRRKHRKDLHKDLLNFFTKSLIISKNKWNKEKMCSEYTIRILDISDIEKIKEILITEYPKILNIEQIVKSSKKETTIELESEYNGETIENTESCLQIVHKKEPNQDIIDKFELDLEQKTEKLPIKYTQKASF